ncbi:hypothetical protein SORBI_3009G084950 [Sorghum bicolor]|uniref:Uncharacterized protein n=1 Tax=Sorghum bicolor TaxID=4558 RepID=A0A1Z5R2R6_SORBI|nr:hypothetical protein SORBI_3009G084950 [Sorghum bicolor]
MPHRPFATNLRWKWAFRSPMQKSQMLHHLFIFNGDDPGLVVGARHCGANVFACQSKAFLVSAKTAPLPVTH